MTVGKGGGAYDACDILEVSLVTSRHYPNENLIIATFRYHNPWANQSRFWSFCEQIRSNLGKDTYSYRILM
jgi:hypothetical protein